MQRVVLIRRERVRKARVETLFLADKGREQRENVVFTDELVLHVGRDVPVLVGRPAER